MNLNQKLARFWGFVTRNPRVIVRDTETGLYWKLYGFTKDRNEAYLFSAWDVAPLKNAAFYRDRIKLEKP